MAEDLLKRKFDAAVNTIKSLPKNGPFQPSNSMKLKFYSLYKQVTLGPVNTGRPSMFDPIGRAKWDAWNGLGNMSSTEAMQAYVDEIVDAAQNMADSPERDQFLAIMAEEPAVEQDEKEEVAGQAGLEDAYAHDIPMQTEYGHVNADANNGNPDRRATSPALSTAPSETDTEEFCDTMENLTSEEENDDGGDDADGMAQSPRQSRRTVSFASDLVAVADGSGASSTGVPNGHVALPVAAFSAPTATKGIIGQSEGVASDDRSCGTQPVMAAAGRPGVIRATVGYISSHESTMADGRPPLYAPGPLVDGALQSTVQSLSKDVTSVSARLADVEAGLEGLQEGRPQTTVVRGARRPWWWPFEGWDRQTILAFFLWPFFANFFLSLIRGRGATGR